MLRPKLICAGALALLLTACRQSEPAPGIASVVAAPSSVSAAAAADVGEHCVDVGRVRACFVPVSASAPAGVAFVKRPSMPEPIPPRGWRCSGTGAERVCEDRARGSSPFVCDETRCVQHHPRMPDDGEWECADLDGVVVCRGWSEAAGVVAGRADAGWLCGPRRGAPGERICVDFAPDRPEPEPYACRFQYQVGQPPRVCQRGGKPPLGRACSDGCPLGSACVAEHCLPLSPRPACWTDKDCSPDEKCGFGSCLSVSK